MDWYRKSSLSKFAEVTLYHGTTLENARSIMKGLLTPGVGYFVEDMYGSEYDAAGIDLPELSFAADKHDLRKAVSAMIYQVGRKLGKSYMYDVSIDELRAHGAIIVFSGEGGSAEPPSPWSHRGKSEVDAPEGAFTVEPGDYYTDWPVRASFYYSGSKLIQFLRRKGFIIDSPNDKNPIIGLD